MMKIFEWEPSDRRSLGRPGKSWIDCVKEDLHRAGISRYGTTTGRYQVALQQVTEDKESVGGVGGGKIRHHNW